MKYFLVIVALFQLALAKRTQNIHQNDSERFSFDVITQARSVDDLKNQSYLIGLPNDFYPHVSVQYLEPTDCPFDCSSLESIPEFWAQKQTLQSLETATFVVSPMKGNNQYFKKIRIQFDFDHVQNEYIPPTQNQFRLLSSQIMNWDIAKNWIKPKARKRMKSSSYPAGTWLSFKIENDGMSKLSYSTLSSVYSQISSIDPRSIMLYTGPELGRSKTQATNQPIQDNLVEIGISITGENDGSFDSEDEILFYGNGPSGYNVSGGSVVFNQNLYFTDNTYYLLIPHDNSLRGQRVSEGTIPDNITLSINYGLSYVHQEIDMINPSHSGLGWASSPISHNGTYSLNLNMPSPESTIDASVSMGFLGGELTPTPYHNTNHRIYCYYETVDFGSHRGYASWSSIGSQSANFILSGSELSDGSNLFYAVNSSNNSNSQPYFDYINLQYGRHLTVNDSYDFYSPILGTKVRFALDEVPTSSTQVWDVSNVLAPKYMILNEGDKAPDFNLQDTEGNKVTLNELLGKKIVIYFYPKDDTPGCTIEACEIRDNYSIFKENNITVLGVSADSIESHKNFTDKFNLPFPLLADVNKNMCEDYDVLVDKVVHGHTVKGIARITFLIDEAGVIIKIWNPVDPNGHADEILHEISQN